MTSSAGVCRCVRRIGGRLLSCLNTLLSRERRRIYQSLSRNICVMSGNRKYTTTKRKICHITPNSIFYWAVQTIILMAVIVLIMVATTIIRFLSHRSKDLRRYCTSLLVIRRILCTLPNNNSRRKKKNRKLAKIMKKPNCTLRKCKLTNLNCSLISKKHFWSSRKNR